MATTPLQFMSLLTDQERGAISAAGLQSPAIFEFLLMLVAAQEVNFTDPRTSGGIAAMIGAGLLTQSRADALIAALQADRPPLLTIAASRVETGPAQSDGRFWATEVFTLSDGSVRTSNILYAPTSDAEQGLAAHAAALTAELAQQAAV